jgi:hypothetical protein
MPFWCTSRCRYGVPPKRQLSIWCTSCSPRLVIVNTRAYRATISTKLARQSPASFMFVVEARGNRGAFATHHGPKRYRRLSNYPYLMAMKSGKLPAATGDPATGVSTPVVPFKVNSETLADWSLLT